MNCSECRSQRCENSRNNKTKIIWKFDYNKLFKLLAIISLIFAWYLGGDLNKVNWQQDLTELYRPSDIKALNEQGTLFSLNNPATSYVAIASQDSYGGPITIASRAVS